MTAAHHRFVNGIIMLPNCRQARAKLKRDRWNVASGPGLSWAPDSSAPQPPGVRDGSGSCSTTAAVGRSKCASSVPVRTVSALKRTVVASRVDRGGRVRDLPPFVVSLACLLALFSLSMIFAENRYPLFGIMLYAMVAAMVRSPPRLWRAFAPGAARSPSSWIAERVTRATELPPSWHRRSPWAFPRCRFAPGLPPRRCLRV